MYDDIQLNTNIRTSIAKYIKDYKNLINFVLRHTRCIQTWLRKKRDQHISMWNLHCRYPTTLIERSHIVRLENGNYELQLKRDDVRNNKHCFIISLDATVRYISKYATKRESASNAFINLRNQTNSVRTTKETA